MILGRAAIFDAHHRLTYAALVAVFVAYVASGRLHIATHAIVTWNAFAIDEPGKAKRRRRARDSRVSGVKSLCELARER
jgi:hypothetical protein